MLKVFYNKKKETCNNSEVAKLMFGSSATSMSKFDSSAASTCSKYLSPKKLINEVNDIDKSLNVLDVTDDILTKSDSNID